jgi:heme-degrading monooxygenase HmoA
LIAVIFESWPKDGKMQTYLDMGAGLAPLLSQIDGFISIERFQSFSDPKKLLALSIWRDEAAVDAFRNWKVHRGVQSNSRRDVFDDYRLRVAAILRDYGMNDREQAPRDSREAHRE